jgi:hypothetical protein
VLLTYTEFGLAANSSQIDKGHLPVPAGTQLYFCWVPITWGDSPRTAVVDDCDDWKDVLYPAASLREAEAIALDAFGPRAEFVVEAA